VRTSALALAVDVDVNSAELLLSVTDVGEDRLVRGGTSTTPDILHDSSEVVVMVEGGWGASCSMVLLVNENGCCLPEPVDAMFFTAKMSEFLEVWFSQKSCMYSTLSRVSLRCAHVYSPRATQEFGVLK
jgi:hypothetical protein